MESVKTPLNIAYNIYTRINRIWQHSQSHHISGVGDDAIFEKVDAGWYVAFNGSYEALFFGMTPPPWAVGDEIKITFTKVT